MSILVSLVARHCDLSCYIVFYYYSCAQVANKIILIDCVLPVAPYGADMELRFVLNKYMDPQLHIPWLNVSLLM